MSRSGAYFQLVSDGMVRLIKGRFVQPALDVHQPVVVVGFFDSLIDFIENVTRSFQALADGRYFVTARLRVLG